MTELVSNSVRHAPTAADHPLRLRAKMYAATLRIELWNAGTDGTVAVAPPRVSESGGFGLQLVAMLSSDWGVDRDEDGTTVWLELPAGTS